MNNPTIPIKVDTILIDNVSIVSQIIIGLRTKPKTNSKDEKLERNNSLDKDKDEKKIIRYTDVETQKIS